MYFVGEKFWFYTIVCLEPKNDGMEIFSWLKVSATILNNDYCFSANFLNHSSGDEVCKFLVIITLTIISMLTPDHWLTWYRHWHAVRRPQGCLYQAGYWCSPCIPASWHTWGWCSPCRSRSCSGTCSLQTRLYRRCSAASCHSRLSHGHHIGSRQTCSGHRSSSLPVTW